MSSGNTNKVIGACYLKGGGKGKKEVNAKQTT